MIGYGEASDIEEWVKQLVKEFKILLYGTICWSIYEKHKLIFAFYISVQINWEEIDNEIIRFLLTGLSQINPE